MGLLIIVLLIPSPAAAQSATADGILALAGGDTAAALRILQPLANGSEPDPLAQFFLATMFDIGSGVATSPIRACGLYRKSATPTNPLTSQAIVLADVIRRMMGPRLGAECTTASMAVWREAPPVKFALGIDHWATTNATGFTIGYRGVERTVPIRWGGLEWVFLPTRYTRLDVTQPVITTRHFVEFWFWVPNEIETPTTWSLMWTVYEVTQADAQMVAGGDVTYVNSSRPPPAYDLDAVGHLQVNAAGEVERVVLGSNPQTSIVPYRGAQ